MIANSSNRQTVRSIAMACMAGVLLSLPAFVVCLTIAGAGHGSNCPFHLFFGPEWLVWMLPPTKPGDTFTELWLATLGMFGLYGVYGGILAYARSRRVGAWVLSGVLTLHYMTVVWLALGFESTDRLPYLAATVARFSIVHSVVVVELFVALHLLAFQYALSKVPYRPRMTWPVATILLVGLVAGAALYVWGLSLA